MLIKRTTKLLGDPCHSVSRAWKINSFIDDFLRATGIWRLRYHIRRRISLAKYGGFECGRRRENPVNSSRFPGPDHWDLDGKDRTCSYCGSWHPEEFLAFCDEVITNPDVQVRISLSDKRYKIYVDRPGIRNASYGAIKFYMMHAPQSIPDEEGNFFYGAAFIDKVNEALKVSNKKFEIVMKRSFPG